MLKKSYFKKNILAIPMILALLITSYTIFLLTAEAADIVVSSAEDPGDFDFVNIWDPIKDTHGYAPTGPTGKIEYPETAEGSPKRYDLTTNGKVQWWAEDSMSFAYKKSRFDFGKNGKLVAETTLDDWRPGNVAGGAGLMIRSSLNADAASLMVQAQQDCISVYYRMTDGQGCSLGGVSRKTPDFPISFRVVFQDNKVDCYVKEASDRTFIKMWTCRVIVESGELYIGIGNYNANENILETAKFSGFSYEVTVPEGTDIGGNGGGEDPNKPPELVLPEDLEAAPDVLMRETFREGIRTLVPYQDGTTNIKLTAETRLRPYWFVDPLTRPDIRLNADNTKRHLYSWMNEGEYYFAGDQSWTDYSTSIDIVFTDEFLLEGINHFGLYVRNTDIIQYGIHDYGVVFSSTTAGVSTLSLVTRTGTSDYGDVTNALYGPAIQTLHSVPCDYLDFNIHEDPNDLSSPLKHEPNINKKRTLRVDAFDNTITAYLDGQLMFSYTDESLYIHGRGRVGFVANYAAVEVHQLTVTKLNDFLGGDYDNAILGNWDKPIPQIIYDFAKDGAEY